MQQQKKKKVDREALYSPFMRIPRMKVEVARHLLDLDLHQLFELNGRSPEALLADIQKRKDNLPDDTLAYLRMAVYYAEHGTDSEAALLNPLAWK